MLRFTFPKTDSASILIDLAQTLMWDAVWSNVRVINDSTVTGYHIVNGWAKERHMYFAAVFSKPLDNIVIMNDGKPVIYNGYRFRSNSESTGKNLQFLACFKTGDQEQITVKVGISAISTQNALDNLNFELTGKTFENIVAETQEKWDKELSKLQVEGDNTLKETFYTALYHTFLTPMLFEDANGEYRGLDHNIHKATGKNYAVFSLWDTYRATHPLFCLIQPSRNADMINSMLSHYDQSVEHLLPVWSLQGNETWCMIGYHAVPVIADAMMKDLPGFDYLRAYEAMKATALNPNYDNVKTYSELGWVPFDKENESVSKTLEYAFDDFCIAQAAGKLGMKSDSALFMQRAESYKNLFDPKLQLMRGRDSQGQWRTPFNSHEYVQGGDFTEATSWQYSWYVPQDIKGLIDLYGNSNAFTQKLDSLFTFNDNSSENMDDVQGRIGEYWHGNEPSHHIIYLYDFTGKPYKTQELVHNVIRNQYGNQPASLTGNDDCGQMSAWYLFSVMGFYPVCPGSNYYAIGSPCAPLVKINFENGRSFQIKALNLSDKNIYIQKVTLNGKIWNKPYIGYHDIINGGELIFEMGAKPNLKWGKDVDLNELNVMK
jgi:predicted alpha-1,2-mannosidase